MNYEVYPVRHDSSFTQFRFQSKGRHGIVEKAINFSPITGLIYNLALLDFDPITQDYSDKTVTDNGDMPEILATVMAVMMEFLDQYPERMIYFTGSSDTRTRLYQIAITKVLNVNESKVTVLGYLHEEWVAFEPNKAFESFLIAKKDLD